MVIILQLLTSFADDSSVNEPGDYYLLQQQYCFLYVVEVRGRQSQGQDGLRLTEVKHLHTEDHSLQRAALKTNITAIRVYKTNQEISLQGCSGVRTA